MIELVRWTTIAVGMLMAAGTLLSFWHAPHWAVRLWDFPRAQIAAIAVAAGVVYALAFYHGEPLEMAFLALVTVCVAWQLYKVFPYTPLAGVQVQQTARAAGEDDLPPRLRLMVSNVLMENIEHARFLDLIRKEEPDVILALETDQAWADALTPLHDAYPHRIAQPQENYYGMMLFSRLPLVEPSVEFLVQRDIPSIHTGLLLNDDVCVTLHGLHPRPPEPIRDQDATPRDAELILMGRRIRERSEEPTAVAGDLNDVAWSPTSELFVRLSGLLDPRIGRGMFNSYNAHNPIMRYPLDHVFHSNHFRLVELRRLPAIGSDHFPLLVALSYEPEARTAQPENEMEQGDAQEAEARLEDEREAARTGDDRPGRE